MIGEDQATRSRNALREPVYLARLLLGEFIATAAPPLLDAPVSAAFGGRLRYLPQDIFRELSGQVRQLRAQEERISSRYMMLSWSSLDLNFDCAGTTRRRSYPRTPVSGCNCG